MVAKRVKTSPAWCQPKTIEMRGDGEDTTQGTLCIAKTIEEDTMKRNDEEHAISDDTMRISKQYFDYLVNESNRPEGAVKLHLIAVKKLVAFMESKGIEGFPMIDKGSIELFRNELRSEGKFPLAITKYTRILSYFFDWLIIQNEVTNHPIDEESELMAIPGELKKHYFLYLEHKRGSKLSKSTIRTIELVLCKLFEYCIDNHCYSTGDIDESLIQSYFEGQLNEKDERGFYAHPIATVNNRLTVIKGYFTWLEAHRYCNNSARTFFKMKEERKISHGLRKSYAFTEKQEKLFRNYLKELDLQGKATGNPRAAMRLFFSYLNEHDLDLFQVKLGDVEAFQGYLLMKRDDLGRSHYTKGSVSMTIGSLHTFYDYLRRKKQLPFNPFSSLRRIRNEKKLPHGLLNEEKMNQLLGHLSNFMEGKNLIEQKQLYKAHVIAELLYSSGMRIHEAAGIRDDDIDFVRAVVKVIDKKGNKEKECILNDYCQKVLRIYVDEMKDDVLFGKNGSDRGLLFGSKRNLNVWFNQIMNRECMKLDLPGLTSHKFRHAVGYHLLRSGCDIRFIQSILGHESLNTTQIYTRVDTKALKKVLDDYHPRQMRRHKE